MPLARQALLKMKTHTAVRIRKENSRDVIASSGVELGLHATRERREKGDTVPVRERQNDENALSRARGILPTGYSNA